MTTYSSQEHMDIRWHWMCSLPEPVLHINLITLW